MSKVNSKYIKFGTGTNEVNSQKLPANFTPTNYTPDEVDSEGSDKVSAHLKGIDSALSGGSGSIGDIGETSFNITNNTSSESDITGLVFANATVRSFEAHISVEIDATAELYEVLTVRGIQKGSSWSIDTTAHGDNSAVTLSITSAGQVQYVCDDYAGFVSGKFKFRAITTTVG